MFEKRVEEINKRIEEEYLGLVNKHYKPLFEEIINEAIQHMKLKNITQIRLNVHNGLFLKEDGKFYGGKEELEFELEDLPEIYQEHSRWANGQQGLSFEPTIIYAINIALYDLRAQIKRTLAP